MKIMQVASYGVSFISPCNFQLKNDPMGSVMSLDVEAINRRNEDRMRKLKKLGGERDDISIGNPDEILDQFMASQRHNR